MKKFKSLKNEISEFCQKWGTLQHIGTFSLASAVWGLGLLFICGLCGLAVVLIALICGIDNPPEQVLSVIVIIFMSIPALVNISCIVLGLIKRKESYGLRCALLSFLGLIMYCALVLVLGYLSSIG